MRTLIVLNPHSGGGRAGKIFHTIEENLYPLLGDYLVAITHEPEGFARQLDTIVGAHIECIIVLGGDGTNYAILNELAKRPELNIIFGTVPMGTGRDWARSLGISVDPCQAHTWIGKVEPVRCDLGQCGYTDLLRDNQQTSRIFLNVASTGISRDVIARVNRAKKRTKFTFLKSTLRSLMSYKPQEIVVECDGKKFFEGKSFMLVVANGRSFGRGMMIAPGAVLNDGLFDVVIVEYLPFAKAVAALPSLYKGTHINRPDVHVTQAKDVTIRSLDGTPIDLDLDGEEALGTEVHFTIKPQAINMLMIPELAAVHQP